MTNGHLDVIRRTTRLFDRVIVAVLVNQEKRAVFTVDERVAMINEACAGIGEPGQVIGDAFEGLLVHYAARQGACATVGRLLSLAEACGISTADDRPLGRSGRCVAAPLLGQSILLCMSTARPWWDGMGVRK